MHSSVVYDANTLPWLELTPSVFLYSVLVVLLAGVLRGFTGFGFSALTVAGLSWQLAPAEVVPLVIMMEVLASSFMLPSVWPDVPWRSLGLLLVAMFSAVPLGVYALMTVPADLARVMVSLVILVASIALLYGVNVYVKSSIVITLVTGFVTGVVNGLTGMAGLVLVIFFLLTRQRAVATRAALVAIFFVLDIYTSVINVSMGLVAVLELKRLLVLSLPLALGVFLGSRQFGDTSPEAFKRIAIWLLLFISLVGLLRYALALL